jgi:hypothetical protein
MQEFWNVEEELKETTMFSYHKITSSLEKKGARCHSIWSYQRRCRGSDPVSNKGKDFKEGIFSSLQV